LPGPPLHVRPRAPLPPPGTGPLPTVRQPPPGAGPIQPFSQSKIGRAKGVLSQSGHYFVSGNELFVNKGAPLPHFCQGPTDALTKDYLKYEGASSFLKDCLHAAEEIMAGRTFRYDQPAIRSESRETQGAIGESDASNVLVAQAVSAGHGGKINQNADPNVGEGYLIV